MFRFEIKYLINSVQMEILKHRLASIMPMDSHGDDNGHYRIRSLYFDDYDNRCFYENANGVSPREKYRLRLYNGSTEYLRLECKRKDHGLTQKTSCECTMNQARILMDSHSESLGMTMIDNNRQNVNVYNRLLLLKHTTGMHPVIIIEYDRNIFINAAGNVRVTFDTNLTSSTKIDDFLLPELSMRRLVMPTGMHLMEIKYDQFLPDFIYRALNFSELSHPVTFSKYYICRKFTL